MHRWCWLIPKGVVKCLLILLWCCSHYWSVPIPINFLWVPSSDILLIVFFFVYSLEHSSCQPFGCLELQFKYEKQSQCVFYSLCQSYRWQRKTLEDLSKMIDYVLFLCHCFHWGYCNYQYTDCPLWVMVLLGLASGSESLDTSMGGFDGLPSALVWQDVIGVSWSFPVWTWSQPFLQGASIHCVCLPSSLTCIQEMIF